MVEAGAVEAAEIVWVSRCYCRRVLLCAYVAIYYKCILDKIQIPLLLQTLYGMLYN